MARLPSRSISTNPAKVLLNGGNAGLSGQRPASSHSPKNRAKEASCQRRNLLQLRQRGLERREVPEVLDLRVRLLDRGFRSADCSAGLHIHRSIGRHRISVVGAVDPQHWARDRELRSAFHSRTAWMRRIAASPRLTMAIREIPGTYSSLTFRRRRATVKIPQCFGGVVVGCRQIRLGGGVGRRRALDQLPDPAHRVGLPQQGRIGGAWLAELG